jgi:hypothetical protein
MSVNSMTPKLAAVALVAAILTGMSVQQLVEYGIEATTEQAQAITQEVLSLNLFWIFAAIETHLPRKYQPRPPEAHLGCDGSRMGYNRSHWFSCLDRLP